MVKDIQLKKPLMLAFDKSLGGVQSSQVRKWSAQKFQQENQTLHDLKARPCDFQFADTEAYHYQQYQEMLMEEWINSMVPQWETQIQQEEKRLQSEKSEDVNEWDYLVSKRELSQIEKHILRAERARGLRDHRYYWIPQKIPRETPVPKTLPQEKGEKKENIQKTPRIKTEKPKLSWAEKQIKEHRDRMVRGRDLTEQRNDEKNAQPLSAQAPPRCRPLVRKEIKECEWVTAYPIVQPHKTALIEVTVLMEKANPGDKMEDNTPKGVRQAATVSKKSTRKK